MRSAATRLRQPKSEAAAARGPFSARRMLSATLWLSNTVGFWNLRPMPSSAIEASSRVVRSVVPAK